MIALLLLALALSADAFAVSLVRGAAGAPGLIRAAECGLAFGVAHGLMPLIGWSLGALFAEKLEAFDHWVAFGLLSFLGVRMIYDGLASHDQTDAPAMRGSHLLGLAAAAVATSVDAAAAGLTLDLFDTPVWLSCTVIGLVITIVCTAGYWFAAHLGPRFGGAAKIAGGVVLILLGVRILIEHLG